MHPLDRSEPRSGPAATARESLDTWLSLLTPFLGVGPRTDLYWMVFINGDYKWGF